ncbi:MULTISPECIES: hypothetical protein [Caproicibacterium]|uniref:Uncharacterized protein n=1 Tax=Caproicibacterium argilliputei TaxID=3030016 RepID=A0AA97DCM0_9FIRM|nr:hypothetical protein [Caproicibacterium argilliputei]WOC33025.1 hypothetical protein PXC00_03870 [Caproicibacterium argilliputei]
MGIPELIKALRRNMVETGNLVCLGCGHEHSCSTRGCAIMREAADSLERLNDFEHSQCAKLLAENEALTKQLSVKSEQLESLRTIFYEVTGSVPSKAPKNKPLTLKQLRGMDGEPVWIVLLNIAKQSRYEIVTEVHEDGIWMVCADDDNDYAAFGLYGKTWLAYRRPPKAGEK